MLEFKIKDAVKSFDEDFDRFNSYALKIEPVSGYVNPESSVQIQVDHIAMTLGRIDHYFQLEVNDSSQFHFLHNFCDTLCRLYIYIFAKYFTCILFYYKILYLERIYP